MKFSPTHYRYFWIYEMREHVFAHIERPRGVWRNMAPSRPTARGPQVPFKETQRAYCRTMERKFVSA